jgi:hypothetical protein
MAAAPIIFTCTFYASEADTRLACCLRFLEQCARHGLSVVVVDASPKDEVRELMRTTCPAAHVVKQTATGRKGAALREALGLAAARAPGDAAWLCWQEPEKEGMAPLWPALLGKAGELDVVVPRRARDLFRDTYPVEQYHSESFANALLTAAAGEAGFDADLDWHFGPFGLRKQHAHLWRAHGGELWDAQVVPVADALRAGLRVGGVEVPFSAPADMKAEEEGSLLFIRKRLDQINFLDPKVMAALARAKKRPAAAC